MYVIFTTHSIVLLQIIYIQIDIALATLGAWVGT